MLGENTTWRIAQVFFDRPSTRFGLREIGRQTNTAHTAVKPHLKTLQERNIIRQEQEQKNTRTFPVYTAQQDSDTYRFYRQLDVLERIHTTGLINHLEQQLTPDCIVLFGSAARGEDSEDSDIDLFIQADEQDIDLSRFEETLKRPIQLHISPAITDYPDELQNNIANGHVLYGRLTVK